MNVLTKWLKMKREALKNTRDWTPTDTAVRVAKIDLITDILKLIDNEKT